MKKFSIIIPVYNEEKMLNDQLMKLVAKLEPIFAGRYEIIIVENGSTDNTLRKAQKLAERFSFLKVIRLNNPSYGQAFKCGILESKYPVTVQFDLDFWDINFLKKALRLADSYDVIIGSKNLSRSHDGRSRVRRLLSKAVEAIIRLRFNSRISDSHGLKVIRKDLLIPHLPQLTCSNHFFDSELLLRMEAAGNRFREIPVSLIELRSSRFSFLVRARDVIFEFTLLMTRNVHGKTIEKESRFIPVLARLVPFISIWVAVETFKKLFIFRSR
jgi:dolichyl-phosphate beta-glucosyltransferase